MKKDCRMGEWYVYDRYGRRRKARPEEIPKPIEHGCDLTDGTPVMIDSLKPEKRSDHDAYSKKKKNVRN